MSEITQVSRVRVASLFDGVQWHDGPLEIRTAGAVIADIVTADGTTSVEEPWTVLDLGAGVAVPALTDLHMGICTWGQGLRRPWNTVTQAELTLRAATNARALLRLGVTTVLDTAAPHNVNVAVRDCVGTVLDSAPRIVACGTPIGAIGRPGLLYPVLEVNGADEARAATRRQIRAGVDAISLCVTSGMSGGGRDGLPGWQELTAVEIEAVTEEAHRAGLRVVAKAVGADGISAAVAAGVDSIAHGTFADEPTLRDMAQKGISLVPTISVMESFVERAEEYGVPPQLVGKARTCLEAGREVIARARDAGVVIGIGTDPHHVETIGGEVAALVRAGLPVDIALQGATSTAHAILGDPWGSGCIRPGAAADLIVLAQDPRFAPAAIDDVRLVMVAGHDLHQNEAARDAVSERKEPA